MIRFQIILDLNPLPFCSSKFQLSQLLILLTSSELYPRFPAETKSGICGLDLDFIVSLITCVQHFPISRMSEATAPKSPKKGGSGGHRLDHFTVVYEIAMALEKGEGKVRIPYFTYISLTTLLLTLAQSLTGRSLHRKSGPRLEALLRKPGNTSRKRRKPRRLVVGKAPRSAPTLETAF